MDNSFLIDKPHPMDQPAFVDVRVKTVIWCLRRAAVTVTHFWRGAIGVLFAFVVGRGVLLLWPKTRTPDHDSRFLLLSKMSRLSTGEA